MDAFEVLGLRRRLVLEAGEIDGAVNGLLKTAHPDAGGSEEEFGRVKEAGRLLKSSAERVKVAILLAGGDPSNRGTVPGEVMDFFSPVAGVLEETGRFVSERGKAVSGLGKAVIDVRVPDLKKKLEELTSGLLELQERQEARFGEFDAAGWENVVVEMGEVFRTLRFVEKWLGQLREATGKIFEALLGG